MPFTKEQYEAKRQELLYAESALRYGDRSVTLRTVAEIKEALAAMEPDVFPQKFQKKIGVFYKGL